MSQNVKKKRGRPPKSDPGAGEAVITERGLRRSLRCRNVKYVFELDDYLEDDELFENDEDHRRKLKKLKPLLELQNGGGVEPERKWSRRLDHEPTTSASLSNGAGKPSIKRKIDYEIDEDIDCLNGNVSSGEDDNEEKDAEVRERKPKHLAESPLPDKKDLELILNKLQKKDIYGVYAEPVDPEELPDYHDMIKHPMDFATVRNKLRNGSYETMEQFEHDVFLICTNAMQYNEPDTVYHKQAHSIKELAIRKFHKIRLKAKSLIIEFKTDQRMRPGNGDWLVEGYSFFNDNVDNGEESGKGALSRFSTRSLVQDEYHRATYNPYFAGSEPMFSAFEGESKQLVPVGLYSDFSYARSLARFAATLGSVAWKFTSKRIEQILPQGLKFGRGWVGEYEPLPAPVLILQNCTVKEPPFFAKVKPAVDHRKFENVTMVTFTSKETPGTGPVWENELPSLFLSPGIKPHGSARTRNQQRNSQSRTSVQSDQKIFKQFDLTGLPWFHKNAAEPIGRSQNSTCSVMEAPMFKEFTSRNINYSESETFKQPDYYGVKAARCGPREQDKAQLMRMLAAKDQNRHISCNQSPFVAVSSQALFSVPTSSISNDSSHAVLHAAPTWMPVAPGRFGNANQTKNQIDSDLVCNSTCDIQPQVAQICADFPSKGMHVRPERSDSTFYAYAPQGPVPVRVDNEIQFHNQPMVYPHVANAELSRSPVQSTWWNLGVSPGDGRSSTGILSDLARQYRQYI